MKYYKGYYMITSRCNLSCSYCVLEDSKEQLKRELPLELKKELINHLYSNLNFRSLTISGGEPILIGKNKPKDFLNLLEFLKQYKSDEINKNLYIHLYTNAILLTPEVAKKMDGVVDEVSINIDGYSDEILRAVGRTVNKRDYLENFINAITLLNTKNIQVKLHTVLSQPNITVISDEVISIYKIIKDNNIDLKVWKFYQYMSYDSDKVDKAHIINNQQFNNVKREIINNIGQKGIQLYFKDNNEMNNSLFNILPYGNAQYMEGNDTWSTTKRTEILLNYSSIEDLFSKNKINRELFERFHTLEI